MGEVLRKPWTVGVSRAGTVLYALPWKQIADAWLLERIHADEVTVYLVDRSLPQPPAVGMRVDPAALGWEEVVRHQPEHVPA